MMVNRLNNSQGWNAYIQNKWQLEFLPYQWQHSVVCKSGTVSNCLCGIQPPTDVWILEHTILIDAERFSMVHRWLLNHKHFDCLLQIQQHVLNGLPDFFLPHILSFIR